ncbi:hypothetical protein RF11_06725 [Thelohanellus kitauei]|uniref:CCHC-type domain-containing protein n=1 Tax=Thelohanellus kitauei TaxID=669202 RepID=A0A0C2IS54_THEKT|nr:hypothetical protein RF11_06725 [Thelohanellus kitauei]
MEAFNDQKESWASYKSRFLRAIKIYGLVDLAEEKKTLLLLHNVGAEVNNILTTQFYPRDIEDIPFQDILTFMDAHCGPKKPLIVRRMEFQNRKRRVDESVENYVQTLKTLAATCEFGQKLDERVRDQLIMGIENPAHQQDLVKACDSNAVTLGEVIKLSLFLESTSTHTNHSNIMKLQTYNQSSLVRNQRAGTLNKDRDCLFCGRPRHKTRADCPASNVECYNCQKRGHFASVCLQRNSSKLLPKSQYRQHKLELTGSEQNISSNCDNDGDIYLRVVTINKIHEPIYVNILIHNVRVKMNVDSGAAVSCIGKELWKKLGSPELGSCQTLRGYMGSLIPTLGKTLVTVHHQNKSFKLPIYVIDGNDTPLMGLEWMKALRISIKFDGDSNPKIHNVNSLQCILDRFPRLFSNSLGNIRGYEAIIRVPSTASPTVWKYRPVPFAIRDKVELELDRLLEQGANQMGIPYSECDEAGWVAAGLRGLQSNY